MTGFNGRLERLLALARARQIDLARIALPHLIDQLIAALREAGGRTPLGLRAEWVVMAAWLVQLRSRLLLPAEAKASDAANREATQLRRGLARLDAVQAAARWLDERPRLGRDVFPRGRPELMGIGTAALHQVDVVEFLWASLALFDDDLPHPTRAPRYRPAWLDLHAVPDAAAASCGAWPMAWPLARWSSYCLMYPAQVPHLKTHCAGARAGPACLSPAWNWPNRAQ